MIEYVPGRYKASGTCARSSPVPRARRSCRRVHPAVRIARGLAGPAFLAHVLVSKYGRSLAAVPPEPDLCPRGAGSGSLTLADWVGGASELV